MTIRYDFPIETQIGNVGDPDPNNPQDVATKNYVDTNSGGFILDTPGVFTNASVASGNIVLTSALSAGSTSTLTVQTTGAAGTETAIQTFITGRGTSQLWAFAGFNTEAFTITANGSTASGQVTLTLGLAVTFPAIPANTVLQYATTNPTFTPVKDLAPGAGVSAVVGTNSQGRATVTLSASGSSVSVNNAVVTNPNFQNNSAPLGTNLTVNGSNITAAVRNADVVAVADAEILSKWGGLDVIIRDPDQIVPIIATVNPGSIIFDDRSNSILIGNYLWINSTAQNNGGTLVYAQSGQNFGAFQYQIFTVGNPQSAGFTNTIAAVYYSKSATPTNNFIISPAGATQAQWGTIATPLALGAADSLTSPTTFGPGASGQVLTSAGPGRSPSWQNASAPVTLSSSIDLGSGYVGDNVGSIVRVASTSPTYSNINGNLAAVTDFGSINITSTPWPPTIPAGYNTNFVIIEASDFSWSGCGVIQTTPSNAIVQIAWIRRPTVAVGTTFTNGRLWITTNATASQWVTTSTANIANVNPTTALVLPDLTSGSITTAADGYGSNASVVQVVPTIDNQIATNIGQAKSSTSGYVAGNVSSVTLGFGNAGTTWQAQTTDYAAAVAFLQTQGATPPAGGAAGNWTLPSWTLYLSNIATPTTSQFATITVIAINPANSFLQVTFSGNQSYFANAGQSAQPLFISSNKFTFVNPPQAEIIRLAQANDVASLNTLQGNVNLVPGTGIAISSTAPNITITNTGGGSGISAGNSTTFRVNQRFPGVFNLRGFANTASGFAYFALPIDGPLFVNVTTSGGVIGNTTFVSSTNDNNPTYGEGVIFPTSAANVADVVVIAKFPAFSCQVTVTGSSPSSAAFSIDEAFFARRELSLATDDPTAQSNQAPGFMAAAGNPNESQPLGIDIAPIISATYAGNGIWNLSFTASQFSGSVGNFALTGSSTQGYQVYLELEEDTITQNISAVSNIVVTGRGSMSVFFEIPGTGGSTPTLQQVTSIGNTTNTNIILTGTGLLETTAGVRLLGSTNGNITLLASATTTSYTLTLPPAQGAANTTLLNNGSGVLSWGTAASNLTQVLTNGNSAANLNLILTGTGTLQSTAGLQLNGSASGNTTIRAAAATTSYTLTLPQAQGAANTFLLNNGSGILSWDTPPVPNLGQVLTSGNSANNTNLVLTGTGTLQTTAGLQLNGSASGNITLRGSATTTSYTITMPAAQGAAGTVLTNDGSGNLSWGSGSGAINTLTQVLGAGNSAANLNLILTGTGLLQSTAGLQLNGSASGNTTLRAAASPTSYTITLPAAQGAAGTTMVNDGSGNLSWQAGGSGGSIAWQQGGSPQTGAVTTLNLNTNLTGSFNSGVLTVNSGGSAGVNLPWLVFTATAGQTAFTNATISNYTTTTALVIYNSSVLIPTVDYSISGQTLTLVTPTIVNDVVAIGPTNAAGPGGGNILSWADYSAASRYNSGVNPVPNITANFPVGGNQVGTVHTYARYSTTGVVSAVYRFVPNTDGALTQPSYDSFWNTFSSNTLSGLLVQRGTLQ